MSEFDPRTALAREDLAEQALEGLVKADAYRAVEPWQCAAASAAIRGAPGPGAEPCGQLLFGEAFDVLDDQDGRLWGRGRRDGCVGWVEPAALAQPVAAPTHRVWALRAAAYAEPDAQSPTLLILPLNGLVVVEGHRGRFAKVARAGWIAAADLAAFDDFDGDPVAVAERHLGAAYRPGGRDSLGVDGPGLMQQAYYACGRGCPREADLQALEAGQSVEPAKGLKRGDFVFWPGSPALMVDADHVIHADAFHRSVVIEPLADAVVRNRATGLGEPAAYRRP